jgi:hypothetical protein
MFLAAATLALVAMPVRAQTTDATAGDKVKELETAWGAAMVRGDWAAIEKMLAPVHRDRWRRQAVHEDGVSGDDADRRNDLQ